MKIEVGRRIFQLSFIRMSYRERGSVPRTQRNMIAVVRIHSIDRGEFSFPVNRIVVMNLRISMLVYSAKKIKANKPPIYSTLNPETSSDSPSAKSKGLRFTSAMHVVAQISNIGKKPARNHRYICGRLKCVIE